MCTSPLRAFYTGSKTEKGGDLLAISAGFQGCEEVSYHEALKCCRESFPVNSDFMHLDHTTGYWFLWKYVDVPCGKCDECLMAYAKTWAYRAQMEWIHSSDCWFVTLTYDALHNDGSVHKRHVQLFMKRLRKIVGSGCRFFGCLEYGEHTHRPHAHLILFNCPVKVRGFQSPEIGASWPHGHHMIEPVNAQRCAYVARYTSKKMSSWKVPDKFEQPCLMMSRRPGIGERWLITHRDTILATDRVYLPSPRGVQVLTPPRYHYRLLEKDGIDVQDFKDAHAVQAELSAISECGIRNTSRSGLLDAKRKIAKERRKKYERDLV